jgi:hypothetical protein
MKSFNVKMLNIFCCLWYKRKGMSEIGTACKGTGYQSRVAKTNNTFPFSNKKN